MAAISVRLTTLAKKASTRYKHRYVTGAGMTITGQHEAPRKKRARAGGAEASGRRQIPADASSVRSRG
jgi:hypothetical protein